MANIISTMLRVLALAVSLCLSSCTHWLIDTETRIQVENKTNGKIRNLSIVSQERQAFEVLVKGSIEAGERSEVHDIEWVGKFKFAVFSGNSQIDLGVHTLNGGSILAIISEDEGKFTMMLK
jgi:hypothetical protein